MDFLYLLEKIRNPVLDFFFSAITYLGDTTVFLLVSILVFWCIDKRKGYYILLSGLIGTVINQAMKLFCKVPRPWVIDSGFKPVGNSIEAAGGYSFPSGHSQNAVSTSGVFFLTSKNKWVRGIAIAVAVLVPFSRMYLGVHTPLDVIAGVACAVAILLVLEPVFNDDARFNKFMPFVFGCMAILSVGFFIYATITPLPSESHVTYDPVLSAKENASTLLGCTVGGILVYVLDRFVIKFRTDGVWYSQIIKLVLGLAVVMLIKTFADIPLAFMGVYERIVRYFLIVTFAGVVWPLTFGWFSRLRIGFMDRFTEWVKSIFAKKAKKL